MPTTPDELARIVINERQYLILEVIRDLPSPDRYTSGVSREVDIRANRPKPTNPAAMHAAIGRLEQLGLIKSERDHYSVGRGVPRRWLSVTSLGNEVLEYYRNYKFRDTFIIPKESQSEAYSS